MYNIQASILKIYFGGLAKNHLFNYTLIIMIHYTQTKHAVACSYLEVEMMTEMLTLQ